MSLLLNREHTNGQLTSTSYAKIVETVLKTGVHAGDRTGTGTMSVSYVPSYYMLTGGSVPLISGKSVNLKPLLVELEWYLKGTGNIQFLKDHGVKIWDAWADENGDLGPVYGKQWRRWNDTHVKRTLAAHKGDLLIAALIHDPRLRAVLAESHQRPTIYEVSQ